MEEKRSKDHPPPDFSGTPTKPREPAPASAHPPSARRRKRKSGSGSASAPPASKRQKSSAAIHAGPTTRARQSPGGANTESVAAAAPAAKDEGKKVDADLGYGDVAKVAEEEMKAEAVVEEDLEALEAKIEAEYEAIRCRDRDAHVVPIHAGWFSWKKIHSLERRTLPSFFNGKSEKRTPEIYLEIRNWIMRKFHADPNTQIEQKDLLELSFGELDARQEVMGFLDHWGLINYHPFPEIINSIAEADDKVEKTNSIAEILYRFERAESCALAAARDSVAILAAPSAPSGIFPESTIAEELARQEGPSVEYHCNSCSADCSRKRYHCQKQADYDLCMECFNVGKFDSDMSPADFILMESAGAAGESGGMWTDQETLLLLEALELFSENWNEIADHVATKTKAQCILHFIQMPIEENIMDYDDGNEASNKEDADSSKTENDISAPKDESEIAECKTENDANHPPAWPMKISVPEEADKKVIQAASQDIALKALIEAFEAVGAPTTPKSQFSFAEAGNPVMALAAYLVRLAEPNVVTATIHNSLKCISDDTSSTQLAARHCFLLENPPDDEKKSAECHSAVAEAVEFDTAKNEKQNEEVEKQDMPDLVLEKSNLCNDDTSEKDNVAVNDKEKEASDSPNDKCTEKSEATNMLDSNESDKPDLSKDKGTTNAKESDELTSKVDTRPDPVSLPVDNEVGSSDLRMSPPADESNRLNLKAETPPSSVKELSEKALEDEPSEVAECAKKEVAAHGALASETQVGDGEPKDIKNENQDLPTTMDEVNIDKLKCAAVTALSAAAVKAKLLADQEEDQIRQLAMLLIEKQLHKLETKLAFFSDMESAVMRMREQMERAKQRLYIERQQIIAARFGVSFSQSRPMQQSLPINRVAMGFANSATRPSMMGMMPSQRPPMSTRPMMTLAPPSTFVPSTSLGNSVRPINQE